MESALAKSLANIESMAAAHTPTTPNVQNASPNLSKVYTPLTLPLLYKTETAEQQAAYHATQTWLNDIIHNFSERARWLVLYGRPGTGKTHLLSNAVKILREFRRKVTSRRAADMASLLRDGQSHLLDIAWIPCKILAIDDLGAEYHTEYITSQWFDLLDARIGQWTLITTNLTPEQIGKRYDARIQSRIEDARNTLVDLTKAADYRKKLTIPL
jgi:DNA replication protein DnaC